MFLSWTNNTIMRKSVHLNPKKEGPVRNNYRLMKVALCAILTCAWVCTVFSQDIIPRTGLKLWITADSVHMKGAEVDTLYDLSGSNNSPTHSTDQGIVTTVPTIVKNASKYNGHAVMHFSGSYTGFGFTRITGIRSVFAVLFKDSTSCEINGAYETPGACCTISPKFWLGTSMARPIFTRTTAAAFSGMTWAKSLLALPRLVL